MREAVCTASVLRAQLKLHFTQHQFVQGLLATIFTSCSQCYSIQMYSIQIKIVDTLFRRQHVCPILLLSKLKGLTDFPRATNAWGDSVCLRADPALAFWLRSNSRFGTRARLCSNPCKAFREATKAHVSQGDFELHYTLTQHIKDPQIKLGFIIPCVTISRQLPLEDTHKIYIQ